MKRKNVSGTAGTEFFLTSNKKNKLNFLFDDVVSRDIMKYRGLTNYSSKRIPYSPKSMFRFFINPHGLDTNGNWYLRINNIVQKNPKILHIYHLPNMTPVRFTKSFNILQHQANCIASVDYKVNKQDDRKVQEKLTNFVHSSIKFSTTQRSAYEKIVKLSSSQNFAVVALVGPAGTGKTVCLSQFVQNKNLFAYVTIQNNLLQDATMKLGLNQQRVYTFCRFIMNLFDLNFYEQCTFNHCITGNQVQNFPRLFCELPVSVSFVKSLFSTYISDLKNASSTFLTGGNPTLFLCIDEFSMISYNILRTVIRGLEHASRFLNANGDECKIIVILSGDCHQIQPIYTMKLDRNRQEAVNYAAKAEAFGTPYSHQHISANCRSILELASERIFFVQQLRNNNKHYHQFLNRILTSDNWQLEIINYFNRRCLKNKIDLNYPVASAEALSRKTKTPEQMVIWHRQNLAHFNAFNYFAWCNVDAHYINMSVFYSIYRTYFSEQQEKTVSFQPRLAPIYFYTNNNFHNGYYDRVRLPFLPLILGMTYKILITKVNTLSRGQLLTLLDIDDSNGGVLTCIDRNEKIYKVMPTFFTMNLFCEDSTHFIFQDINKIAINDTHYARMQKYGKLFGYPLQLVCGDTVRGSIGITVDSDLYINLSGCSLEEIYVILSRTTDERKIKAVHIS